MQVPLQVSFRHMKHSEAIEALVRDKVARLESISDRILACRVVIEPVGLHQEHGNLHSVRIDLTVPGREIVVSRAPKQHSEHKDLEVALRDAFDAARRQLEEHFRRQRG